MIRVDWIAGLPTTGGGFDMIKNHVDLLSGKVNAVLTRASATAAAGGGATRAAMLSFGALARLARAHVLGDVDVLAHPEREASHQRPRLGPPEVSPEGPVVALAKNLRAQSAAGRDAEAVRLTLPAAI